MKFSYTIEGKARRFYSLWMYADKVYRVGAVRDLIIIMQSGTYT